MLDFTREISLNQKNQKIYRMLQAALYLAAVLAALYLSYLIIFPHKTFSFSFADPASRDNNIDVPRLSAGGKMSGETIPAGNSLLFNTDIANDYSVANVTLRSATSSVKIPSDLQVSVRRSYQAFMYPLGDPIGFRTGTLIKSNGNYYMISDSKLRRFSDQSVVRALGYDMDAFLTVPVSDLKYDAAGPDISTSKNYPDDTLFRIADNYYILKNQTLQKFVSDQAYLSRYAANVAITKDASFLNAYPAAADLEGFADGSLISNADSVFIVSKGQVWPIDNPETFIDKGYNWNDVMRAGEDELAIYQKVKLFNITTAHPDGTIFKTDDTDKFYMIEDGQKHLLPDDAIAASWLKKSPIMISDQALNTYATCSPQRDFWKHSSYSCTIPLDSFKNLIGFSYEFKLSSDSQIKLASLSVDYKKNIDKTNLKNFLLNLYNLVKGRYTSS